MIKRIFSATKFFIKKNWTYFTAVFLLLVMFGAGFFCAWRIQERRGNVTTEKQDELIITLRVDLERYRIIFVKMVMQMEEWAKKIESLESQLNRFYEDMERITGWNEETHD